jgi:hypothetical protein
MVVTGEQRRWFRHPSLGRAERRVAPQEFDDAGDVPFRRSSRGNCISSLSAAQQNEFTTDFRRELAWLEQWPRHCSGFRATPGTRSSFPTSSDINRSSRPGVIARATWSFSLADHRAQSRHCARAGSHLSRTATGFSLKARGHLRPRSGKSAFQTW